MDQKSSNRLWDIPSREEADDSQRIAGALDRQFARMFGADDDQRTYFSDRLLSRPGSTNRSDGNQWPARRTDRARSRLAVARARTAALSLSRYDNECAVAAMWPRSSAVQRKVVSSELRANAALASVHCALKVEDVERDAGGVICGTSSGDAALVDGTSVSLTRNDAAGEMVVGQEATPEYGDTIRYLQGRGIDTVLLGGQAAIDSVDAAARRFLAEGFRVVVNCAAIARHTYELAELRDAGAIIVGSSAEIHAS